MINFIKRLRSELWISVNIDNIVTSYKFKELLSFNLGLNDNHWCKTRNNNYLLNLDDIFLEQKVQIFLDYINRFIWLSLNNHIKNYFDDNILDYCVATDFNFNFDDGTRTSVGEAEFSLKYRRSKINDQEAKYYGNLLVNRIKDCYDILPINKKKVCFTTIPFNFNENENDKLSYNLVQKISSILYNYNVFFLKCYKPSFKNKTLNDKIDIWNEIYSNRSKFKFFGKVDIMDKDVIIIDDLYQSGVSMWSYAKFLKSLGAKRVMGISAVKSLRDSDNTNV